MLGQKLGGGLADVADAQGIDEAGQGTFLLPWMAATRLPADFPRSAPGAPGRLRLAVEVGNLLHQPLVDELVDDFLPQAVDVHGGFAGKVEDAPARAPRQSGLGQRVTASPGGRTSLVPHTGQWLGILKGWASGAGFDDYLNDFRYHIASPLY